MKIQILWLIALLGVQPAMAAPCCGGGGQSSIILTDDSLKVSLSEKMLWGIGESEATEKAVFWGQQQFDRTQTTEFKIAWVPDASISQLNNLLDSRLQFWGSVQYNQRQLGHRYGDASYRGMGDFRLGSSWEIITERVYHPFLPRVFVVADFQFPTATQALLGGERLASSFGIPIFKRFGSTQATLSANYTWMGASAGELKVSVGAAKSFFFPELSVGVSLAHLRRSIKEDELLERTNQRMKKLTEVSFSGSYLLSSQFELGFNYMDQTLLGPARFTTLNRAAEIIITFKKM